MLPILGANEGNAVLRFAFMLELNPKIPFIPLVISLLPSPINFSNVLNPKRSDPKSLASFATPNNPIPIPRAEAPFLKFKAAKPSPNEKTFKITEACLLATLELHPFHLRLSNLAL